MAEPLVRLAQAVAPERVARDIMAKEWVRFEGTLYEKQYAYTLQVMKELSYNKALTPHSCHQPPSHPLSDAWPTVPNRVLNFPRP